jgi:DNA-binding LytR/AlgR family response regulator
MLKTLIVEDNRIFQEAFKKGLLDYFPSMAIEEAANGEEALQKIKADSPDLSPFAGSQWPSTHPKGKKRLPGYQRRHSDR